MLWFMDIRKRKPSIPFWFGTEGMASAGQNPRTAGTTPRNNARSRGFVRSNGWETIRWWNANWKQAALIKSGFISRKPGSRCVATGCTGAGVTEAIAAIRAALRDKLREDGLVFVGLDVIGGRLTEVNVTSPTGIQQMSRLDGVNLAAKVLDWIEARAC